MFMSVTELLKVHTIPIINDFDLQCVRRLWSNCGWRGYVVYPTEPAANFVTRDPTLTSAEVANLVDQIHTFPLTAVNLGQYDWPQRITIQKELYAYGHWVAQVDDHVRQITNLETLYCRAGVRVLSKTCLPVVNEADAIFFRRLMTEFGYILVPLLLDRDQIGDEAANLDEAEEDGFLKAFKVSCGLKRKYFDVIKKDKY
ncbi:hypothetical protein RHMOL_Rhmol13G0047700 [Rhododendron molle]|uniref:Uncharacterized protein n=1 Tax=Rhododendron molle TaxID=49168 RepID=A0ACC0L2Y0_RHOML|nr:hypothetical protein RHMOL_Rhmol13G0047700 [Rhododendron molle]